MQSKWMLAVTVLLICAITPSDSFAINLTPGNYEIKNWIDLPGGGSSKVETRISYIDGSEKELSKLYTESGCDLLSKSIIGNTLTYELKCKSGGVERISGSFIFTPESFEASMLYISSNGDMKVGMRGKRVGGSPESKPLPTSAQQLDEIDKRLRGIWNSMISYASSGNFGKALELFHPHKRKEQSVIFEETRNEWLKLKKEQIEFRPLNINNEDGYARYDLVTIGKDGKHRYGVLFQKDQNDNWYIVEF